MSTEFSHLKADAERRELNRAAISIRVGLTSSNDVDEETTIGATISEDSLIDFIGDHLYTAMDSLAARAALATHREMVNAGDAEEDFEDLESIVERMGNLYFVVEAWLSPLPDSKRAGQPKTSIRATATVSAKADGRRGIRRAASYLGESIARQMGFSYLHWEWDFDVWLLDKE